jgi:hypothetical protein
LDSRPKVAMALIIIFCFAIAVESTSQLRQYVVEQTKMARRNSNANNDHNSVNSQGERANFYMLRFVTAFLHGKKHTNNDDEKHTWLTR